MATKKARLNPTRLALDECARRGWIAEKVEQRLPRCFVTKDFLGCIDIIALAGRTILGIQVTSRSNHASRRNKAIAEPRLHAWFNAGGRMAIWSYDTDPSKGIVFREEEILVESIILGRPERPASCSATEAAPPTAPCPAASSADDSSPPVAP